MSLSTNLCEPVRANTAMSTAARPVHYFDPVVHTVRYERILRIQGYSDLERVRPAITRAAREMAEVASSLTAPRAAFTHVEVLQLDRDGIELDGGVRLTSPAFEARLAGCIEVAPVVLSVGNAIDRRVIEFTEAGDLLEAVLLETAGWLCIEDATRQLTSHLRGLTEARHCRITSRMGPGYSYWLRDQEVTWSLQSQPVLFGLFGEAELPVSLMASCAMQPKLSRSGLYGIAPLANASKTSRASLLNQGKS